MSVEAKAVDTEEREYTLKEAFGIWLRRVDAAPAALIALLVSAALAHFVTLGPPRVMGDETTYAMHAKYGAFAFDGAAHQILPPMPNFLFLKLFHLASLAGNQTLEVARLLNVALFGLAAIAMFFICRRFMSVFFAGLLTFALCVGPTATYAAYFMPESMYFAIFWWAMLSLLRLLEAPERARWVSLSLLLGALLLVKPHALAVIGALLITLPLAPLASREYRLFPRFLALTGFLAVCSYGWWWVGAAKLTGIIFFNPTGTYYGGFAAKSVGSPGALGSVLAVFGKHAASIAVMLGFSLLVSIVGVVRSLTAPKATERTPASALAPFTLIALAIIGATVLMSSKFTVDIIGYSPLETIDRMHARYYSFALPLFVVLGTAWAMHTEKALRPAWLAVTALILIGCALVVRALTGEASLIDHAELYTLRTSTVTALFLAAGTGLALVWSARNVKHANAIFLTCFGIFSVVGYLRIAARLHAEPAFILDRAGEYLRSTFTTEMLAGVGIISAHNDAGPFRMLFYAGNRGQVLYPTPAEWDRACEQLEPQTQVAVTLGPHSMGCGFRLSELFGPVAIWRKDAAPAPTQPAYANGELELTSERLPRDVTLTGFYAPEAWGTWSSASTSTIQLPGTVTGCIDVSVKGYVLGPNANTPVTLTIGASTLSLPLKNVAATYRGRVLVSAPSATMTFSNVQPISPKELGLNEDTRSLGVGLMKIAVKACEGTAETNAVMSLTDGSASL